MTQSVNEIIRKITQYSALKDALERMINPLNSSVDSLRRAKQGMNENYTINEEAADYGKINSVQNSMLETYENIRKNIIPAINIKIQSLQREMERLEAQL